MKRLNLITLGLTATFACSHVYAGKIISVEEYQALLPHNENNQVSYDINLATNSTVNYHCDIKETETGSYILDEDTCDQRTINFVNDYPKLVNLEIFGNSSAKDTYIVEHKLWAMAFAHAAMNSMVLMQYGLNKDGGTFNLEKTFTGPDGKREKFGNYFMRNMGPNYYLSKGLQESSLGGDLPQDNIMCSIDESCDDGVLQVEYPGSAWAELQGAGSGGFPALFANMDPKAVLSSNNGPARNILGSAATSAYYNASATGINTGSLEWNQNPDGQANPQNRLHEFIQGSQDPDALAIMLSFMYNRGPFAAKDQPLRTKDIFKHCMNSQELENDWECFKKQEDFGTKYIRQIPDVAKQLNESLFKYNEALSWSDISAYLTLLTQYGFYTEADKSKIEENVHTVFENLATKESISFQHDFGKIIEAMITSVDIKTFAEKGPIDPTKLMTIFPASTLKNNSLFMSASVEGANTYNNWLTPGHHQALDLSADIDTFTYSVGGINCSEEANAAFQQATDSFDPNSPTQMNVDIKDGQCIFEVVEYEEEHVTPPIEEGYWDPNSIYQACSEPVIYNDGEHGEMKYQNQWYSNPGDAPNYDSASGSLASEWNTGANWLFVDDPKNACN